MASSDGTLRLDWDLPSSARDLELSANCQPVFLDSGDGASGQSQSRLQSVVAGEPVALGL